MDSPPVIVNLCIGNLYHSVTILELSEKAHFVLEGLELLRIVRRDAFDGHLFTTWALHKIDF
jgi:hypothetical protein